MRNILAAAVLAAATLLAQPANALPGETVALVKVVRGDVRLLRNGQPQPASVGLELQQSDRVLTGPNGSAGLTFRDGSLLSVGPSSELNVDRFRFNPTTHDGEFETTLSKGKLAVVSGKIAKHRLDAMKVRTPSTTLGVRGTEFLVEATP